MVRSNRFTKEGIALAETSIATNEGYTCKRCGKQSTVKTDLCQPKRKNE